MFFFCDRLFSWCLFRFVYCKCSHWNGNKSQFVVLWICQTTNTQPAPYLSCLYSVACFAYPYVVCVGVSAFAYIYVVLFYFYYMDRSIFLQFIYIYTSWWLESRYQTRNSIYWCLFAVCCQAIMCIWMDLILLFFFCSYWWCDSRRNPILSAWLFGLLFVINLLLQ